MDKVLGGSDISKRRVVCSSLMARLVKWLSWRKWSIR